MFTGCKVFSTTMVRDRAVMGEAITQWIADHPELEVVDRTALQSSDASFHCLSIVLWYRPAQAKPSKRVK
jgi:hypothetical protein